MSSQVVSTPHNSPSVSTHLPSKTLVALSGLRAQAACLVVSTHLVDRMIRHDALPGGWGYMDGFGGVGVRLFFIISGFIMVLTTGTSFGRPGATCDFLIRRFKRVSPLYFLFTGLYALKLLLVDRQAIPVPNAILSYLFIPYRNNVGLMQPVYELGWTLNYEMYFYLIFGVCMVFSRGLGNLICVVLISGLCGVVWLLPVDSGSFERNLIGYYGESIVIYFLLGMGVAWVSTVVPVRLSPKQSLAGSTIFMVLALTIWNPILVAFLCSASVFCAALEHTGELPGKGAKVINLLGDSSYAVYLTHNFVLGPLFAALTRFHVINDQTMVFVVVLAIATSTGVGIVVHVVIEKRLLGLLRRGLCPAKPLSNRVSVTPQH